MGLNSIEGIILRFIMFNLECLYKGFYNKPFRDWLNYLVNKGV